MHILHTVLYTFPKESPTNYMLFEWVIISCILITLMFDSEVRLYGEIGLLSFLGVQGLSSFLCKDSRSRALLIKSQLYTTQVQ